MALRRPAALPWHKYFRFGGLLLVVILFVPLLGIFLTKSVQIVRNNGERMAGVISMDSQMADPCCGHEEMQSMDHGDKGVMRDMMMVAPNIASPELMMRGHAHALNRQVARDAFLDLRAESLTWTVGKIQEIVKNVGGYVENSSTYQPKAEVRTAWLSVRIPSDRLEVTLDEVKRSATSVVSETVNTNDVTDQSIDVTARLNAKLAEETALVSLLDRAEKVSDVIEITSRLTMVRSEIERMQAEKRMLEGQVAMYSLSISITEDPRAVANTEPVRDGNVLRQSLADLYQFGIALGSGLVMLLVSGLPVVIVYGFFFWVLYRFGRFVANRVVKR